LALYCGLQVFARVSMPEAVEFDEGEQVLYAAELRWAYGQDQPLYTWLQWALFETLGVGVLALSLLKQGLLLAFYWGVYCASRRLGGSREVAIAAVCALALLPTLSLLAQRDLTHTVLATTLAAWYLHAWAGLAERRTYLGYGMLGLWLGLGALAKLLFLMMPVCLAIAALRQPRWRTILADPRIGISLGIGGLLVAPHLYAFAGDAAAQAAIGRKLAPDHGTRLEATAFGAWELVRSLFEYAGLLVIVWFAGIRPKLLRQAAGGWLPEPGRNLAWTSLVAVILLALAVILGLLTDFKARWFHTVLWLIAPIASFAAWQCYGGAGVRRLTRIGLAVAIACLVALGGRPLATRMAGVRIRPALPFGTIVAAIEQAHPGPRTVIASDFGWGGSWRLHHPEDEVRVPDYPRPLGESPGTLLLLWDASRRAELPEKLRKHAEALAKSPVDGKTARFFTAQFGPEGKETLTIAVLSIDPASGG
jgi:4-amino-4-deoxy-L-arabinose transferase-like glycosyltransferase